MGETIGHLLEKVKRENGVKPRGGHAAIRGFQRGTKSLNVEHRTGGTLNPQLIKARSSRGWR
jgi:hypothetical protein